MTSGHPCSGYILNDYAMGSVILEFPQQVEYMSVIQGVVRFLSLAAPFYQPVRS
jgi:hypothetical protein